MSGYIGVAPVPQATQKRQSFTATEGQTSFATAGYSQGYIDVFLNGIHLETTDYTATNGSDIVLSVGASSGDILTVILYSAFEVTVASQSIPFFKSNGSQSNITMVLGTIPFVLSNGTTQNISTVA